MGQMQPAISCRHHFCARLLEYSLTRRCKPNCVCKLPANDRHRRSISSSSKPHASRTSPFHPHTAHP
ncbi:hypothetical protein NC652_033244 [Populus alba x Populus x berolinensis]|uniref:Uncharacterized protein n=1 Tax=Populus alba x Populus x berolinensis TaxID=444605 RepID=A0AAD6LVZ8_9ROSI|nr:hypothetical protein NC652_033244 [Populus alba x Populus x berolinensis]KAJ6972812.1 hypothetical protein NC653_033203 [Populus alba x Populus x berolinensis]